jgi:glutamate-1-semialdehyde 2,1-aminomutase
VAGLRDRATYQLDPARRDDALAAARRDAAEGADILMVKPGLPYLDVLAALSAALPLPFAAYQTSGEQAALDLLAREGLADGDRVQLEAWTALARAGARIIISYAAWRPTEGGTAGTGASDDLHRRALRVTPGGVHSPVRGFGQVGGTPVYMREAQGAILVDVDGREYLDFCLAFGPLILGHADAGVVTAVREAAALGTAFGTAEPYSLQLAEFVTGRIPWVEQLRLVNSGTEAVMTALRIARAATGRDRILKFAGCYHGHADAVLVEAAPGDDGAGVAGSAGIPDAVVADTRVAALDDEAALAALFARVGDSLAAVIIEPLPANLGLLPQRREFLERLAGLCQAHGVLLVFDEVISGFRVAFGGMAELTGIRPDLVTSGKVIGGGLGVAAYGGRADLMAQVAPAGPVYQAGTLAANPLGTAAGLATLERLADGIYLPPSAAEVFFLATAHSDADIRRLAEALRRATAG